MAYAGSPTEAQLKTDLCLSHPIQAMSTPPTTPVRTMQRQSAVCPPAPARPRLQPLPTPPTNRMLNVLSLPMVARQHPHHHHPLSRNNFISKIAYLPAEDDDSDEEPIEFNRVKLPFQSPTLQPSPPPSTPTPLMQNFANLSLSSSAPVSSSS